MAHVETQHEPRETASWLRPKTMLRELEDLLSRYAGTEPESWITGRMVPPLDLLETKEAIEVRMDLPDVDPADVDIRINGNLLTISGERKAEREVNGKAYHRVERRMGSFSRSVTLPCKVAEEKIDANYQAGVLSVMMPKAEEAKGHKIVVKA